MQDAGSATPDEALSTSMDDSSNIYTTGYFTGNATFGTNVITAAGVSDVFVTKVNNNGIFRMGRTWRRWCKFRQGPVYKSGC